MARSDSPLGPRGRETGITESFELWRIELDLLRRAPENSEIDLPAVARPDERWHHQVGAVRQSGDQDVPPPTHYARSSRREHELGALLQIFESKLAEAIDTA